jgi:hypothetical protein
MRPFQTIAQVLVAISVVNCLRAPLPREENESSGLTLGEMKEIAKTAGAAGAINGGIAVFSALTLKEILKQQNKYVPFLSALS